MRRTQHQDDVGLAPALLARCAVLHPESWLKDCWEVLPDAALSGESGGVGVTLSQGA